MAIPDATKLAACAAAAGLGSWVTLFTGAAGTTGINEQASPTRMQTAWSASTNKYVGTEVKVPAAAGTYVEAGVFSASSGGTFVGSGAFTGGNVIVSGTNASIDVTLTWQ
jgi:hypothetical protein